MDLERVKERGWRAIEWSLVMAGLCWLFIWAIVTTNVVATRAQRRPNPLATPTRASALAPSQTVRERDAETGSNLL